MATQYTYTNSEITFNNLQDIGNVYPLRIKKNNFSNIPKFEEKGQVPVILPFVNAVEIDWNGAIIGES